MRKGSRCAQIGETVRAAASTATFYDTGATGAACRSWAGAPRAADGAVGITATATGHASAATATTAAGAACRNSLIHATRRVTSTTVSERRRGVDAESCDRDRQRHHSSAHKWRQCCRVQNRTRVTPKCRPLPPLHHSNFKFNSRLSAAVWNLCIGESDTDKNRTPT
jgi:hypothetical protein